MEICYNIFMFTWLKQQKQKGFTLVELLVTISIFVILTGVVMFSQSKFNGSVLLTNLAYDTALTLRQAQNYGINIRENTSTGVGSFLPYGVHFNLASPKSFILFADTSYRADGTADGLYSNDDADINTCQADKGCVNRYNIKQGNYISDLCVEDGAESCGKTSLDIVFKRPSPEALIRADNSDQTYSVGIIKLKGADGSERKVRVQANGLIEII